MAGNRVLLWRHGQTDWNIINRFQGHSDIPLNDVGRYQVQHAAEILAGMNPTTIISSDLGRAHETAKALAKLTGLSVSTDENLRETNGGLWEGKTGSENRAEDFQTVKCGPNANNRGTIMSTTSDDMEGDRRAMGERLRQAREYLGFSQEEVAKYLNISRSALSNIETGQRKVDALELKKLASLYKRPATQFTGEDAEDQVVGEEVAHLARKASELSSEDRAELGRFADFLRAKKQTKGV